MKNGIVRKAYSYATILLYVMSLAYIGFTVKSMIFGNPPWMLCDSIVLIVSLIGSCVFLFWANTLERRVRELVNEKGRLKSLLRFVGDEYNRKREMLSEKERECDALVSLLSWYKWSGKTVFRSNHGKRQKTK